MGETGEKIQQTLAVPANPQGVLFSFAGIFFLFCALLSNVGIYYITSPRVLWLFTPEALGWIAAGLRAGLAFSVPSLFKALPKTVVFAWCGLLLLFCIHLFSGTIPSLKYLHLPGGEMLILALPLLFCLCFESCRKAWIRYGVFLWALNNLLILLRLSKAHPLWKNGICGNENWSGALIVMGVPLLYLNFKDRVHTEKGKKILLGTILGIATMLNLLIGSKGALLGIFFCTVLFLFLQGGRKTRKILLAGILLLLLAGGFAARIHAGKLERFLAEDARLTLYQGAFFLIRENMLTGTSQWKFENEFMKHRPLEYFFVFNPASRSNHPHNHFLYMASSWGIPGLLCLLILLGVPIFKTAGKLYRHENCDDTETACFFILLYGLFHGALDLIADVLPTQILFWTSLGILLHFQKNSPLSSTESPKILPTPERKGYKYLLFCVSGAFLLCGGVSAYRAFYTRVQLNKLNENSLSRSEALELIRETVRKYPGDYQVDFAFMNLLERKYNDPLLSLEVSEAMLKGNTPNYPGVNMGRGNALMKLGRFQEAWNHYKQEALLFPLTLRPVYNMVVSARAMKNYALAQQCEQVLLERMRIRKLSPEDLQKILRGKGVLDLRAGYKP